MKLNETLLREPWAQELLDAMDRSFRSFLEAHPGDPPATPAKWYHFYFCEDCGVFLHWDLQKPKEHCCPNCERLYTGDPYDGSWAKMLNGAIVFHMECAAILALARKDNSVYLEYIRRNMLYFATHYHEYSLKDKQAGIGKVFPQGLTEAVFVISMERCLRLLRYYPLFSDEEYALLKENFFREAARLIEPQISKIHNIHAWMQAAVAACASILGDRAMLERTIHGEYGWINQLEQGCRKDGLWYEVSPGYHFYTLNALLSLGWIAKDNGIDLFSHPTLKQMGIAPLYLAYPDRILPAYNDTSCGKPLQVDLYEQLAAAYDDPFFAAALDELYEKIPSDSVDCFAHIPNPLPIPGNFGGRVSFFTFFRKASAYDSVEIPSTQSSFLLADTGIAVLQNDLIRVGIKANKYGGGHDHNDKISIDLYDKLHGTAISYDTGTCGYGIKFTTDWQRSSVSHNLVVVNGERQSPSDGQVVFFTPTMAKAIAEAPYPGVRMEREIHLLEKGYRDLYTVKCQTESVLDYAFHCVGTASLPGIGTVPVQSPLYDGNGYPLLMELKKAIVDTPFQVVFEEGDLRRTLNIESCPGTEVYIGRCYGELTLVTFGIVIIRRRATETQFSCEFTLS